MTRISRSMWGFSKYFNQIIEKLFGLSKKPVNKTSFRKLCQRLTAEKVIKPQQGRQIEKILELENIKVKDIMITRAAMCCIESSQSLDEVRKLVLASGHSRFPVIDDDKKKVIGILFVKDLVMHQNKKDIKKLIRKALYIPESKKLNNLLHEFQQKHQHMAIIIDEYGDYSGLVTIEDIIEQITGDIEDEHDPQHHEKTIRKDAEGHYSVKSTTTLDEFNAFFKTAFESEDIDTIGGIILKVLGYIPEEGESIHIKPYTYIIKKADERKIQTITVCKDKNQAGKK